MKLKKKIMRSKNNHIKSKLIILFIYIYIYKKQSQVNKSCTKKALDY
jgi:hypothetical protein